MENTNLLDREFMRDFVKSLSVDQLVHQKGTNMKDRVIQLH